jgi:hypothetical protein
MPLEYDNCLENGLEVVRQCARWFYGTNASHYNTQGFDYEDIEGHLNSEVLMRYLDLIQRHPDFYLKSRGKEEIAAFRSSLYQSCRNACFAHHRKHIRSQKRGLNLRHGVVHLDHSELNSEGIVVNEGLIVSNRVEYSVIYRPIADGLYKEGKFNATRLWCLLWHENKANVAILMGEVGEDKDQLISDIKKKVLEYLPEDSSLSYNIMNQAVKNRFKELAQKALQSGAIKAPENGPEESVSKLLGVVSRMNDAQAEAILRMISGNDGAGPVKPTLSGRREAITENAKQWMVIDYEIVSDALDIEINPEMNPLIIRRLLDTSLERMDPDAKRELPEIVWEFIRSINEVFPDTYREGSKLEVEEMRDSIMVVRPPIPAPSFISHIRDSRRWMSWIDANSVRFWQESERILFESATLKDVDHGFMQVVLDSFSE